MATVFHYGCQPELADNSEFKTIISQFPAVCSNEHCKKGNRKIPASTKIALFYNPPVQQQSGSSMPDQPVQNNSAALVEMEQRIIKQLRAHDEDKAAKLESRFARLEENYAALADLYSRTNKELVKLAGSHAELKKSFELAVKSD